LVAISLAVILFASAVAASAAALGVNSGQIAIFYQSGTIPISDAIADDGFAATVCNEDLDGSVDSVGNVWTSHSGEWRYQGCGEVRVNGRVPMAHASLDLGVQDDIRITSTLTRISTQKNHSGPGIAFFSDGSEFMYVIYDRDQGGLILGWVDSSGISASPIVPISDRATAEISVELSGPDVTVLVDGAVEMTATIPGPVYGYFEAKTGFGLVSDNDNWSRFGSFMVEPLA
jgi:hypothetical protein